VTSRIVYEESRHRYSLDGKWVPSVTTIRGVLDKPGLVGASAKEAAAWAAIHVDELTTLGEEEWRRTCAGAGPRAWAVSRDKGTLLHNLAERLVYGDALPTEDADGLPFPDDVYQSAQQLAGFMDAWQVDPVAHEAVVFNDVDHWAGRLDLIGDLSDGARWLLDYKTGASGVWSETSMQLAAYAHATHIVIDDEDLPMPAVDKGGAVWVRPDAWQLIPVAIGAPVYDAFRRCQAIYPWTRMRKSDVVGAPLPVPAQATA
jgi:hypothetical protein